MSRIVILISIFVSLYFVHTGLLMKVKVQELTRQKQDMVAQNNHMIFEISERLQLPQKQALLMSKAFSKVVNETRYLESNSGTTVDLTIEKSADSDEISSHYQDSQYHGVKKLPVVLHIDKSSSETDLGAVLSDIYQLEIETDFKVTEINKDGTTLLVKGDIYGI